MTPTQQQPVASEAEMTPEQRVRPKLIKRDKTFGEWAFDIGAYGGFAIGLNEVLATWFIGLTERNSWWKKGFEVLRSGTEKIPVFKEFPYVKTGRMAMILVAFLGGTLAAIPILWAERVKGPIVRAIDNWRYGKTTVANDPDIRQAHKEMDEAPPQTWRSITDGRVVTMATALAVDSTFCHNDAISSQLIEKTRFKDTWLNSFSSMERACHTMVRWVMDKIDPNGKEARFNARNPAKPFEIQDGEGKWTKLLGRGSMLMTLSVALTIIFYVSSKFFANRIEMRKEAKRDALGQGKYGEKIFAADAAPEQAADTEKSPSQPSTRIRDVALTERSPSHAMIAGV